MSSLTNYAAQALLNSLFGKTSNFGALASAPTLYIALSTSAPNEGGTGVTEPSGGAYARVATSAATWNSATLADPSVVTNAAAISFPEATASWGTVTHLAVYTASSGGTLLMSSALSTAKSPTAGDTLRFDAGDLSVSLD